MGLIMTLSAAMINDLACILFIGRMECSVEIDKTLVMAAATSRVLPCIRREKAVDFEEELCHADIAAARGEGGVLDEKRRLHVARNI